MTLDDLSEAWNELRNAALGRGTAPIVPAPLAADVARQYGQWRAWHAAQDALVMPHDIADGVRWIQKYRKLLSRVSSAGAQPAKVLPRGGIEASLEVAANLQRSVAWGLVGTGVAIALYMLSTARRGYRDA